MGTELTIGVVRMPAVKSCVLVLLLACPAFVLGQSDVSTGTSVGVAPATAAVQVIPLPAPAASETSGRKTTYTIKVPGTGVWIDAGVAVSPADHLEVRTSGELTLADGRKSGPEGVARGWKDLLRGFPLQSANAGALVGRIGNAEAAVPFALGGSISLDVPSSGELFLAANTGDALAGTGEYTVTLKLSKAASSSQTVTPTELAPLLTPALLAGVPRRVTDQAGDPGDVVNFPIVGTDAEVRKAFTAAGWTQVDKTTNDAVLHGLLATLSKKAYTEMPMSTLYLFGRPQDLSYARADPLAVALVRHHLRVWNSGQTLDARPLWVGSATHDNGLERDERDNGVTHHIDPNIDTERDFIEASFASAGALAAAAYATPPDPVHDAKTATGGSFKTDGRLLVMELRPQSSQ